MATDARVRLLDADPDIGRLLSEEERQEAGRITLPVLEFAQRELVTERLAGGSWLAAVVIDGMLLQRLRLQDQTGMRVLGPGDYLLAPGVTASGLFTSAGWSAGFRTHLAIVGSDMLAAIRRWPTLIPAWHERLLAQNERLAAQLAICQLPKVTDRVLGIMWLLADSWGRVTTAGVVLPLTLTHEALGALIGARRPTVTLAIRELTERGALMRQDRGWLLLESPPEPASDTDSDADRIVGVFVDAPSGWRRETAYADREAAIAARAELLETVARMRSELEVGRARVREQIALAQRTREHVLRRRARAVEVGAQNGRT